MPKSKWNMRVRRGAQEFVVAESEEARICLECPLPRCDKLTCKRFDEEKEKLRRGNGGEANS